MCICIMYQKSIFECQIIKANNQQRTFIDLLIHWTSYTYGTELVQTRDAQTLVWFRLPAVHRSRTRS